MSSLDELILPVGIPADQDRPGMNHIVCSICHPEAFLGMPALCGEKLLGQPPITDADNCNECEEMDVCPVCGWWA